ncbi:putative cytochrome P450 [Daldinia eschscholtzii]|nr:putative cytochrome P450 [Daldinia eschscholtzii]
MANKQFKLSGKDNGRVAVINVSTPDSLVDLKCRVASVFDIASVEGISMHNSKGVAINAIESIVNHDSEIRVKVDGKSVRSPCSPKRLPIIGNYLGIYSGHMDNHERLFSRYGSVIKIIDMGTVVYLTNHPRICEMLLSENDYFTRITSDLSHPLHFMKGKAALISYDSDASALKAAQKFITPGMSPRSSRRYADNIQQTVEGSFDVFDEIDRQGMTFPVYEYMVKMASQMVYRICLGSDIGHFTSVNAPLHEIIHKFGEYTVLLKRTSISPSWHKYLPYGKHRRLSKVKKQILALIGEAIDNAETGGKGEDLPMREAALQSTCIADYLKRAVDEHGNKLPKEDMLTTMVVRVGAGFITTASSLSWLIYSLTHNPGIQERLLQELAESGAMPTRQWTYDEITTLPFLDCFIKETHRMYNPGFQAAWSSKKDVIVPGGWLIPANSVIIPTTLAIQQSKNYWESLHIFNPDRWSDETANENKHRLTVTPFQAGLRGDDIAIFETKLTIANLVWRYHFENDSREPLEHDPESILDYHVRASKRTSWPEKSKAPRAANIMDGADTINKN